MSGWNDWEDMETQLRRKNRKLRSDLKAAKAAIPKPIEKARAAAAVVRGLNGQKWDQTTCHGSSADVWLRDLFDYLRRQGIELK